MKYSDKPEDWYFEVYEQHEDISSIALSNNASMLDDQLGAHNLPQKIKDLLRPLGVYVDSELMESIFELTGDSKNIEEEMIKLGFNKVKF